MRTSFFHGDGVITIGDAPEPSPMADEVLIRVLHTALCGSDIKLWRKGADVTAGHEIVGRVEQPGHPRDEERCAIYIPVHCGRCDACRAGHTQMCLAISQLIGWDRPGGYAECLAVPETCLLPIPADIDDRLAPLLLDTIGTSAHAVRTAAEFVPPRESGPVLVTGAGPVGLGAVIALRDAGYADVHVCDPNDARRALAVQLGATAYPMDASDDRFALIIECSGAHVARDRAIQAVLPRGAILLVGENPEPWTVKEGPVFRRKDFFMIRTFYFPKHEHEANVALLRRHQSLFEPIADTVFDLEALPAEFERFVAGQRIKPLLSFNHGGPSGSHTTR